MDFCLFWLYRIETANNRFLEFEFDCLEKLELENSCRTLLSNGEGVCGSGKVAGRGGVPPPPLPPPQTPPSPRSARGGPPLKLWTHCSFFFLLLLPSHSVSLLRVVPTRVVCVRYGPCRTRGRLPRCASWRCVVPSVFADASAVVENFPCCQSGPVTTVTQWPEQVCVKECGPLFTAVQPAPAVTLTLTEHVARNREVQFAERDRYFHNVHRSFSERRIRWDIPIPEMYGPDFIMSVGLLTHNIYLKHDSGI